MSGGFRPLGDRLVHQGRIIRVVETEVEAPDGQRFTRDVVRSPGAVAVVPVRFDPEGQPFVVLVRQYRAPVDDWLLELPAGMRDVEGEAPVDCAQRELQEECGLRAGRLEPLPGFLPAPGFTDQRTELFLGLDLEPVEAGAQGVEEEHMTVSALPLPEALAMVEDGRITDSKTIIGLLLVARRLADGDR